MSEKREEMTGNENFLSEERRKETEKQVTKFFTSIQTIFPSASISSDPSSPENSECELETISMQGRENDLENSPSTSSEPDDNEGSTPSTNIMFQLPKDPALWPNNSGSAAANRSISSRYSCKSQPGETSFPKEKHPFPCSSIPLSTPPRSSQEPSWDAETGEDGQAGLNQLISSLDSYIKRNQYPSYSGIPSFKLPYLGLGSSYPVSFFNQQDVNPPYSVRPSYSRGPSFQPGRNRPYPVQPGNPEGPSIQQGGNQKYPVQPGYPEGPFIQQRGNRPYPYQPGNPEGPSIQQGGNRPYTVQPGYPEGSSIQQGRNRPYTVQPGYPEGPSVQQGGNRPYSIQQSYLGGPSLQPGGNRMYSIQTSYPGRLPVQPGVNHPYLIQPGYPGEPSIQSEVNGPYPVQPSYPGGSSTQPGGNHSYPVQPNYPENFHQPKQNKPYPVQPENYNHFPDLNRPYPQQSLGTNVRQLHYRVPPPVYIRNPAYGGIPTGTNMHTAPHKKKDFLESLTSIDHTKQESDKNKYYGSYPSLLRVICHGARGGGHADVLGSYGSASKKTTFPNMEAGPQGRQVHKHKCGSMSYMHRGYPYRLNYHRRHLSHFSDLDDKLRNHNCDKKDDQYSTAQLSRPTDSLNSGSQDSRPASNKPWTPLDERKRAKLSHINTLDDVVDLLKTCKRIIVLTGAGVSVSCGIPDFRSRGGLYERLKNDYPTLPCPRAMFDIQFFRQDPRPFFKFAKEIYPGKYKPSPTHRFIKVLEKQNKLLRNYTQNIDTLEHAAGIQNVIACHGSFATATCTFCKSIVHSSAIKEDIFQQRIPYCPICSVEMGESRGIMKPDIVFFGEQLPNEYHQTIANDKKKCDLLIVMGSSLKVPPVARIPFLIPTHIPQILINREPLDHFTFDVELLGDCDVIIGEICQRLEFDWDIDETITRFNLREITVQSSQLCPVVQDSEMHDNSTSHEFVRPSNLPLNEEINSCDCSGMSAIKLDDSEDGSNQGRSPSNTPAVEDDSQESAVKNDKSLWSSDNKESISKKIPDASYLHFPPNRYVFTGAEGYEKSDPDIEDYEHGSSPSYIDSPLIIAVVESPSENNCLESAETKKEETFYKPEKSEEKSTESPKS